MRILLTGAGGFAASYLPDALRAVFGDDVEFMATSLYASAESDFGVVHPLDVTDRDAVRQIVSTFHPDRVIHLAGIAAPQASNSKPDAAWRIHVHGTLAVADALLAEAPDCHLLNVGSGLVYGASALAGVPLDENAVLAPIDAYATTKAAADLALGAYAWHGLKCIRLRPFNHTGARQTEDFAIPSFAMQIARIEAGLSEPVIRVGNLDAKRDLLDVRDVARAYAIATLKAPGLPNGAIFNIASGTARVMGDILDSLLAMSTQKIEIQQDPKRMRPNDIPHYQGNLQKAQDLLGWHPEYAFEETLTSTLNFCRDAIRNSE